MERMDRGHRLVSLSGVVALSGGLERGEGGGYSEFRAATGEGKAQ